MKKRDCQIPKLRYTNTQGGANALTANFSSFEQQTKRLNQFCTFNKISIMKKLLFLSLIFIQCCLTLPTCASHLSGGEITWKCAGNNIKTELNISTLPDGVFVVEIKDEKGNCVKSKLVKD